MSRIWRRHCSRPWEQLQKLMTKRHRSNFQIKNGERRWYALKDKKFQGRSKGGIQLELDFIYNHVRIAWNLVWPASSLWIPTEPRVLLPHPFMLFSVQSTFSADWKGQTKDSLEFCSERRLLFWIGVVVECVHTSLAVDHFAASNNTYSCLKPVQLVNFVCAQPSVSSTHSEYPTPNDQPGQCQYHRFVLYTFRFRADP